jgi:hypothetical protein
MGLEDEVTRLAITPQQTQDKTAEPVLVARQKAELNNRQRIQRLGGE